MKNNSIIVVVIASALMFGGCKQVENVDIDYGESYTIKNDKLSKYDSIDWVSDDEGIAKVDDNIVVGKGPGKAVLTGFNKNKIVAEYTFNVNIVPAEEVKIILDTGKIKVGESISLEKTLTPSNASDYNFSWSSSDENIATVDKHGVVTGVSRGSVEIVCKNDDGIKDRVSIEIAANTKGHILRPDECSGVDASEFSNITDDRYAKAVLSLIDGNAAYSTYSYTELMDYLDALEESYTAVLPLSEGDSVKTIISYGDDPNIIDPKDVGYMYIDHSGLDYKIYLVDKYTGLE